MCIVDFLCTVLCVLFHFQNPFDVIKLVFMPREGERDLSLAERSGHMTVTMPTEPAVYIHVHVELGVLCCFALFVCLPLLASFFLPSLISH